MAYAAFISLNHTIQYLNFQIKAPLGKDLNSLGFILKRLDGCSSRSINRSAINALDALIREAVCKLEDALLSYARLPPLQDELQSQHLSPRTLRPSATLEREMDSFFKAVRKLKEEYSRELDKPLPLQEEEDDGVLSPTGEFDRNKWMTVGLRDQFERIRNELLDSQSEPKVVSVVGMAGIGKTHLARDIYHDPLIGENFDYRVWLSVGPQQQVKHVWAEIVALVEGVPRNAYIKTNIITLVGLLQENLRGRGRCLIVLDDIWSTKVCDSLIRLLRNDGDVRRIMLTTRLEEVAKHHGTSIHQIRFLDNEESWKLLRQNVFGEEYFPRQLEEAGRKIAENCEGLPLLILAIAEILSGLEKTEEYWNKVAESKTTTFTDAYERISEVLFSSYEYLPQYLKACFLYMGVFPQKSQIPLPKLLHLWIVEDVLEPEPSLIRIRNRKTDHTFQSTSEGGEALMGRTLDKTVVSSILEKQSRFGVARSSKMKPPLMNLRSKPGVPMISENVNLWEPNRMGIRIFEDDTLSRAERHLPRDARALDNVNWNSKGNHFKICRYEATKPLESLYLLEPGPSPIRFIEPWEKNKSRDSRLCLSSDLWFPTRKQPLSKAVDISVPKAKKAKTTPKGIAMEYLKKLVSHSLAIVCKRSFTNKIKSCKLHSAYWYLCVKEARKNKFFHVLKKLTDASIDYIESQRRLAVQNNMLFGIKEAYDSMEDSLTARSLLCTGPDQEYPVPICLNLRLLKVLDALAIRLYDFPTEVVKFSELRYLALTHNGNLPSSISLLQQLEYLIVSQHHNIKLLKDSTSWPEERRIEFLRDSTSLPKEIWGMNTLVYLRIIGRNLPDPCKCSRLSKLATLHVNAHSCTEAVFRSIPSLKKLGIIIELLPDTAETLSCFERINLLSSLHSLKCVIVNPRKICKVVAPPDHLSNLPRSLKKLSLNGMGYPWEHMGIIGSLPRLKVLKLRYSAFQGPLWITMDGEFKSLEFLLLEDIDLVQWTTDDDDNDECFPSLQCLIIRHCYKLKEIPSQIGYIPSLKRIEVVDCSPSMVASALQIQDKRNSSVQVVISSSWNRR